MIKVDLKKIFYMDILSILEKQAQPQNLQQR